LKKAWRGWIDWDLEWILGGMGREAGMEDEELEMAWHVKRRRRRGGAEWIFVLDDIENHCFFKIIPNESPILFARISRANSELLIPGILTCDMERALWSSNHPAMLTMLSAS